MPVTDEQVEVNIKLPRSIVDQIDDLAKRRHSTIETEIEHLLENGLDAETSVRQRLERLSEAYRARLAREGRLNQTAEQVMEELRRIREQVADELHPD